MRSHPSLSAHLFNLHLRYHVNGANTRAIVLTVHSVEKMTGSDVSGLYAIAGSYGITSCVTFFLPRGVQLYFLLF